MIYNKKFFTLLVIFLIFGSQLDATVKINKQMLKGKILQTQMYGSNLTVKFVPSKFKSYDGDMVFHFSSNDPEQDEISSYKLKNGKIIYYGNDGSKYRMTLHSSTPTSWIIFEEEDSDGDGKQFGFGKPKKQVYKIIRSVNTLQNKRIKPISDTTQYDKLYMQIYERLDTRTASNKEYLREVNHFIDTAAHYIIYKNKFELKLHNIRLEQHSFPSSKTIREKKKFQRHLGKIKKLNGKIIEDQDRNRYRTFNELDKAFKTAGKRSIELQEIIYQDERERGVLMAKMKKLLDNSNILRQKNEIIKLELAGQKYDYKYYKGLLDDSRILLIPNRQASQKKPLFHSTLFIMALLMEKQSLKYLNSNEPFQFASIKERMQKIESESKKLKQKFNQDFLYHLRTKPSIYPNH